MLTCMSDKSVLSIALLVFLHREISGLGPLQLEINYKGCGFSFPFFFSFCFWVMVALTKDI